MQETIIKRQTLEVSVVVPWLNEQDNILPLYDQINQALNDRYSFEVIFVDDGSSDGSFGILSRLQAGELPSSSQAKTI